MEKFLNGFSLKFIHHFFKTVTAEILLVLKSANRTQLREFAL